MLLDETSPKDDRKARDSDLIVVLMTEIQCLNNLNMSKIFALSERRLL